MTAIFSLPRAAVSREYAALSRRIGRGVALPLADGVVLRLAFAGASAAPSADPVLLEGPAGPLHVADGRAFLRALTGIEPDFDGTGERVAWLHASLLGRLQGGPLAGVTRVTPAAALPDDGVALRVTLAEPGHVFGTTAVAAAATWSALLAGARWRPVLAPAEPFLPLVARIAVPLASHRLPAALLATLEPGDVVLPDTPRVAVDGTGTLALAGRRAQVRHRGTGTIELLTMEAAMEGHEEALAEVQVQADAAPADNGKPLAQAGLQAALRLDFQLGTLALSLGELRMLAPGTVLELADGGAGAIAIACGGRVLGRGEAVDVAGRLGIRITEWAAPC